MEENNQQDEISGKEAYELRKQEKTKVREGTSKTAKRSTSSKQVVTYIIILVVIVALGYGFILLGRSQSPESDDLSQAIPLMSASHITVGVSHEPYNSNPPTSGPHYVETARDGLRDEVIPDEHIVHNLEHGDIWISYNPRIGDTVKEQLKDFAGTKIIITPREANETDIALAAWGRLDTFNLENGALPEQRISDFIKRYINKGPEKVAGSSGGV